jgi:hypothetical protein
MVDLKTMQRKLGGDIRGGQLYCPGPSHSTSDRSLSIKLSATAPNGFVLHSFSPKDDDIKCRDYVDRKLGLPQWQPQQTSTYVDHQNQSDESNKKWRTERALEIWNEAQDPRRTIAEQYLASRNLTLPVELCGSALRFHPACRWEGSFAQCLIAAFRSIVSDQITAVHRIRVDGPEAWPKTQRMMLGPVRGSAIKLVAVGENLVVGEGLETCMAARQLGIRPVWAMGSAKGIASLPLILGVNHLVVLGENDNGANCHAVDVCRRQQWKASRVSIIEPLRGKDINDILMG